MLGVAAGEETIRWLYENHFSAVAADNIAFEGIPLDTQGWALHDWLLPQWGTPIGELWNLEGLSKACEKNSRWTFFLTSAPLHIKGGRRKSPGSHCDFLEISFSVHFILCFFYLRSVAICHEVSWRASRKLEMTPPPPSTPRPACPASIFSLSLSL